MDEKEIEVKIKLPREFIQDILDIALESGITYWADIISYNKDTKEYLIQDKEEPEHRWYLYQEVIFKGLNRILSNPEFQIAPSIRNYIFNAVLEKDAGHIDVDAADCIVQAGLFNEIIYG